MNDLVAPPLDADHSIDNQRVDAVCFLKYMEVSHGTDTVAPGPNKWGLNR